ncbi:MAG: AtpZ/AtpI family protein [Bacteroidetes bacterium]|nr:AtpZ/AtpI family protein [Bacteroidota bacterium]
MEKNKKPSSSQKKQLRAIAKYSGIAFQMIAIILAGVYAGTWLDEKIQPSFPVFKLVLILLSVGLAMYTVIKGVTKD